MIKRRLGATDLQLSVVGFGAWAVGGGGYKFGWGDQDDVASIDAIHAALGHGVNWIDTARVYGLGRSESVVARALEEVPVEPYLVTKCTRVWDDNGNIRGSMEPASIRAEFEASRRALDGRPISLYLLHQPQPDEDLERGWEALAQLKAEGAVRYIGVSNFSVAQMQRLASIENIDAIEPRYSLMNRDIEADIILYCERNDIGIISYSPMGSGLLTGAVTATRIATLAADDWRHDHPDFREPRLSENLHLATVLARQGDVNGWPAGAMACAWVLGHPAITSTIVGFRTAAQVKDILGAGLHDSDEADFVRLRSEVESAVQTDVTPAGEER